MTINTDNEFEILILRVNLIMTVDPRCLSLLGAVLRSRQALL